MPSLSLFYPGPEAADGPVADGENPSLVCFPGDEYRLIPSRWLGDFSHYQITPRGSQDTYEIYTVPGPEDATYLQVLRRDHIAVWCGHDIVWMRIADEEVVMHAFWPLHTYEYSKSTTLASAIDHLIYAPIDGQATVVRATAYLQVQLDWALAHRPSCPFDGHYMASLAALLAMTARFVKGYASATQGDCAPRAAPIGPRPEVPRDAYREAEAHLDGTMETMRALAAAAPPSPECQNMLQGVAGALAEAKVLFGHFTSLCE